MNCRKLTKMFNSVFYCAQPNLLNEVIAGPELGNKKSGLFGHSNVGPHICDDLEQIDATCFGSFRSFMLTKFFAL